MRFKKRKAIYRKRQITIFFKQRQSESDQAKSHNVHDINLENANKQSSSEQNNSEIEEYKKRHGRAVKSPVYRND